MAAATRHDRLLHGYDAATLSAALAATKRSLVTDYRRKADDFAMELVKLLSSVDAVGAARH
jgi:8-hydroxy-5-deazaflavin:NADPH oxidoreductase